MSSEISTWTLFASSRRGFSRSTRTPGPDAAAVKAAASQDRSVDLNFDNDDEKTPHLKAGTAPGRNLNSYTQEKTLPARGGFNLNLDSNWEATARIDGLVGKGGDGLGFEARVLENGNGLELRGKPSFMDDDDDLNIILEEREEKGKELVEKNNNNFMIKEDKKYARAVREEFTINFVNDAAIDEMGPEQSIRGLSGRMENPSVPYIGDEWESEGTYDDLQIVLNDNNHGPMGIKRMPGMIDDDKDDKGEPLVIVVDNGDDGQHHQQAQRMVGEQEPGGKEEGCGDTEKDLGDASKASGEGGVNAPAAAQTKIVYSNQSFHNPFSSQFKYVRHGAATFPGAAGGITGQIRPLISMVPPAERGSDVWRPPGMKWPMPMQKGYHPGYGILARRVNVAGHGSGFDFRLPSYKSIFEVDIDSFEEKPWKLPGIDVSNFFNFGLNEDSWRDYCKQLGQLRLEMTVQSRVRAHESGKAEQNYDPDLPPELAAAVGSQDNPSENANHGKIDAGADSARRTSPVGRPIPVETGSCDRLPSIDTKCLRMHDMDAIIEIICHSSKDGDDVSEQHDNDPARKDHVGGCDETDGLQQDDADHMDSFSPEYNGDKWGFDSRRPLPKNTAHNHDILREDVSHLPSEVNGHPRTDRDTGPPHEERSKKGRRHVRSPFMSASENIKENIAGNLKEESYRAGDGKLRPSSSSSVSVGSDRECVVVVGDETDDDSVMDDRSLNMERVEIASDPRNRGTCEDEDLVCSTKKQKLNLHPDSGEYEDGRDSNTAWSNDCRARSGSSEYLQISPGDVDDEVLQHRHSLRAGKSMREVGDEGIAQRKDSYGGEEAGRQNMVVKERDGFCSRRGGHANSSLHLHGKMGSAYWWKESDISEGTWNRRDEDRYGGRERLEDPRKREHGLEFSSRNQNKPRQIDKSERDDHRQSRNQLDNGSWMGTNHEYDIIGSRQRDRDDHLNSWSGRVHVRRVHAGMDDIYHSHIECSIRRKRERDDGSDQDDEMHYARQKGGEKLRERDKWHWTKQDDHLWRRERIETRPMMRSALAAEEKTWISHLRGNDDYKGIQQRIPSEVYRLEW
ncbi:FIP1[V]-like protein [Salvia miltiorrhiza]|uniref:FIP1[V]-like protein n=1 Tax=Salvia miltiorrhiza TaxID=226208 RepID=UPI0025ACC58B|nr:FIP1[V]-like protein [Salvia miltiorrhiza]